MEQQKQFLDVIDRDLAKSRFEAALSLSPLGEERVDLQVALGRVLSRDVSAKVNVPSFDRSNLDGFAVKAEDTIGAEEYNPVYLDFIDEIISAGATPQHELTTGFVTQISTGGMLPRGANAIVMVENADMSDGKLMVLKPVSPGFGIAFAGTDVSSGEVILYKGDTLTSRETGILAAIGEAKVYVWKHPKIAIISTGNEIISPDSEMIPGFVYDSNARIIADAVKELGCEPIELGIVNDKIDQLREKIQSALKIADMVLLSGGTSKGQGDLSYQAVYELTNPGVVVHGVALKPGKPICLAATEGKPVIVLPGFPTSAIFTFHEFVAPVIRQLSGLSPISLNTIRATLATRINSDVGRMEFLLVRLLESSSKTSEHQLTAYPIGKGSGSVTTFSHADGFIRINRHEELIETGTEVDVQLLSRNTQLADLVIIGSHCAGLDLLINQLKVKGVHTRFISAGSSSGLSAIKLGQCDIASMHLFDIKNERYNQPYMTDKLTLVHGYRRQQGLLFRKNDPRFEGEDAKKIIQTLKNDPNCLMINRNAGSGTRVLIDQLLDGSKPNGYLIQTSNHRAVMAAIQQSRADWGIAIQSVVDDDTIGFLPIKAEHYDFMIARSTVEKESIQLFIELLKDDRIKALLANINIKTHVDTGKIEK